ncbi:hypothetical protein BGZ57DRAFT_847820 [Hyaloscypha finlandica]|nr:hypothetical protein BGZ57DRAFT_847820 [Hyaloscypha finlandica]
MSQIPHSHFQVQRIVESLELKRKAGPKLRGIDSTSGGLAHTPPTCQSQSSTRYPWTLAAAKLESIRETLENLKRSMTVGAPPTIQSYSEVCEGVGFNKYWEREEKYKFEKFYKVETNGANGTK